MKAADRFKTPAGRRTWLTLPLVALPLVVLTGCNAPTGSSEDGAASGPNWEQGTNLTSAYGGYDFESEQPAFGDSEILKIESDEASVEVDDSEAWLTARPGAVAVRILWGQLRGNREATEVIDWSGAIRVSAGGVAAVRTIAFEFPNDHLLQRESRQELGFVSHTRPHYDGLLVVVGDSDDPEATLTFESGPLTQTLRIAELREIDTVVPVDDAGNAVSFVGVPLDVDPACARGGLRGRWLHREGERGVFRGLWVTALGRPIGHVRGHFGINDADVRVWFAKIIARDGSVIGLARGGWQPAEDLEQPGGVFRGYFVSRDREVGGPLGGHYVATRRLDDGVAGVFQGRWRVACDAEPVDDDATGTAPTR